MAERLLRTERERTEPLHLLITTAAAKNCRGAMEAAEKELPQDESQAQKLVLKAPKSALGVLISGKASLHEVAVFVAKRTLERWVRFLKPFASGPGLAVLISRLVYEEFRRPKSRSSDAQQEPMRLVPPPDELFGAAFQEITPSMEQALMHPWIFIADMEAALNLESEFSQNPLHPLRPHSPKKKDLSRSASFPPKRPHTVSNAKSQNPMGCSGSLRRSGAFPWADYQDGFGFRQTSMSLFTPKQTRKYPGPDVYADAAKAFTAPQRAIWGRFPRSGDRRTQCTSTPLSQLGRWFSLEHAIPS